MPSNGDIYVSDGYGNSRIHVYTGTGEYKVCAARIEPVKESRPEKVFPGAFAAAGQ